MAVRVTVHAPVRELVRAEENDTRATLTRVGGGRFTLAAVSAGSGGCISMSRDEARAFFRACLDAVAGSEA